MALWETVLSVGLGGAIASASAYLTSRAQARRDDRRERLAFERGLLRSLLLAAVEVQDLVRHPRPVDPSRPDRTYEVLSHKSTAGQNLIRRCLEVEALGPVGPGNLAMSLIGDLAAVDKARHNGDEESVRRSADASTDRLLLLIDSVRAALDLEPRRQKPSVLHAIPMLRRRRQAE